jgi:hypothetical protein
MMLGSVAAALLILSLCAIICLRCLFQESISRDSISFLSLVNIILCVLYLFAWGVSLTLLLISCVALVVFFLNIQNLVRFTARLKHGRFSTGFVIGSLVMLPIIAGAGFLVAYTRPVNDYPVRVNFKPVFPQEPPAVLRRTDVFSGSFRSGFSPRRGVFEPLNVYVTTFSPRDKNAADLPLVLFVCDVRASVRDYEPFLVRLAGAGYEVRAAEFFTDDNRRFGALLNSKPLRKFSARMASLHGKEPVDADAASAIAAKEYGILIDWYGKDAADGGRAVFLLADSSVDAVNRASANFSPGKPAVVTPGPVPGFGCIEQTDPLFARYLGFERDPQVERPRRAVWQFELSK